VVTSIQDVVFAHIDTVFHLAAVALHHCLPKLFQFGVLEEAVKTMYSFINAYVTKSTTSSSRNVVLMHSVSICKRNKLHDQG
jgi:hypothetical protein